MKLQTGSNCGRFVPFELYLATAYAIIFNRKP